MFLKSRQLGAVLPIVVFIIVVMGLLGAALVRMLSGSAVSVAAEVSGTRAYHAAQSGLQITLTEIFPLDSSANTSICSDRTSGVAEPFYNSFSFTAPGLAHCIANVYCDKLDISDDGSEYHFRVRSEGICQVGSETYSRVILMEAVDDHS
jgi:MSHA biogenesis protein MshP